MIILSSGLINQLIILIFIWKGLRLISRKLIRKTAIKQLIAKLREEIQTLIL